MAAIPVVRSTRHRVDSGAKAADFKALEHPLYLRLKAFDLDVERSELPFSARLARENGWSQDYARRVIEEYKRFLFLVSVSDQMLTPSEAVDEAWHLHLTYSKSYWDDLCGKVLERPLHHQPTEGGQAQGAHFRECYEPRSRLTMIGSANCRRSTSGHLSPCASTVPAIA